jgi:hypothetical protein
MDVTGIKAATAAIIEQLPGTEAFLDAQREKIGETVTASLNSALACFADGLSEVLRLGYSINGASIEFEMDPIQISKVTGRLKVNMPLVPKEAKA